MPGTHLQKDTHLQSPDFDRVSLASLDSGFWDLFDPAAPTSPQNVESRMAQQWPQYTGARYGPVYPPTHHTHGYATPQSGYFGYGVPRNQHPLPSYQPFAGYHGHYHATHAPNAPGAASAGGFGTQGCTSPYGHQHHAYPTFAGMRAVGQGEESKYPYELTYPPSPISAVMPYSAPTFPATSPQMGHVHQSPAADMGEEQQLGNYINPATSRWHESIPAWSKAVPQAEWNAVPLLDDRGDHALTGYAQLPPNGQFIETNSIVPLQHQTDYTGAAANGTGFEQASPAITNTSSLRQIMAEADDDGKMAAGIGDDEIAEGMTCINTRNHYRFEEAYAHAFKNEKGLYTCPFADRGRCTHEPKEKKCDYDKMVDAHIKQWRCTKLPHVTEACSLPMSSSAIRFRHEREQHDFSPYWCLVEGCERSKQMDPVKAFARQYNRNDHLCRKHGWAKEIAEAQDQRYIGHDPKTDSPVAIAAAEGAKKRRAGKREQREQKLEGQRMAGAKKHGKQKVALQRRRASAAVADPQESAPEAGSRRPEIAAASEAADEYAISPVPYIPAPTSTRPKARRQAKAQTPLQTQPPPQSQHGAHQPMSFPFASFEAYEDLPAQADEQNIATDWKALFNEMHDDLHRNGPSTHGARGSQEESEEALMRLRTGADIAWLERFEEQTKKLAEVARAFLRRKAVNEGVDPNIFR